eukprot:12324216-Alexandrium_andersonii.AAC.1
MPISTTSSGHFLGHAGWPRHCFAADCTDQRALSMERPLAHLRSAAVPRSGPDAARTAQRAETPRRILTWYRCGLVKAAGFLGIG